MCSLCSLQMRPDEMRQEETKRKMISDQMNLIGPRGQTIWLHRLHWGAEAKKVEEKKDGLEKRWWWHHSSALCWFTKQILLLLWLCSGSDTLAAEGYFSGYKGSQNLAFGILKCKNSSGAFARLWHKKLRMSSIIILSELGRCTVRDDECVSVFHSSEPLKLEVSASPGWPVSSPDIQALWLIWFKISPRSTEIENDCVLSTYIFREHIILLHLSDSRPLKFFCCLVGQLPSDGLLF